MKIKLDVTSEEKNILTQTLTSEIDSIMENLQSEESGKYTCDRYNQGYAERSVLEMLKYRIDLLLKLTEEVK
tara:strand:- start:619 stop:834 length:216 start_codon:yes stop_codon:yes gene_type:complete